MMSFIIPLPYRLLALLALMIASVGFGYVHGLEVAAAKVGRAEVQTLHGVIRADRKQVAISASVGAAHEATRSNTRTIYQTIDREVIRYVQTVSPAATCQLDAGWVRLHDAAALSHFPDAASEPDSEPSGITAAASLPTITGNYQACRENEQQLIDLQRWVIEQEGAWTLLARP